MEVNSSTRNTDNKKFQVILFYKYHPLSKDRELVALYRSALEYFCASLDLKGRILVGCNEHQSEGINGTLSGSQHQVNVFVAAMTHFQEDDYSAVDILDTHSREAIQRFWNSSEEFYQKANCEPLVMTQSEFKWSTSNQADLFPDLNIKLVNELIGTGGVLASIPLEEIHQGYLTPAEWHQRISQLEDEKDSLLIDCRNIKECQIGNFKGALDPNTTTFNQFPAWVQQHSQSLANKNILMYCTGGIRCEKASAYIRRQIPSVKEVKHLKGGIHKYLDQYGNSDDCLWQGKNFVFDGRGAHKATETSGPTNNTATTNKAAVSSHKVVGKCSYCPTPYDTFHPKCICTVCREPTLVCPECKKGLKEYHCRNHEHLKACYFTDLAPFSGPHLKDQLVALQTLIEEIAVGRKFKQRRKTLKKQCDKILERLAEIGTDEVSSFGVEEKRDSACRSCGETVCSGNCWGFHGLKRKRILDERNQQSENGSPCVGKSRKANTGEKRSTNNVHLQEQKKLYKRKLVEELTYLELARPVSAYVKNRLRVPPPCTRVLQTNAKGKWCGKTLLPVLQNEYSELAKTERLEKIFRRGLLRLNGEKVTSLEQAESLKLKNMDVISRIVHWHEPPIQVPSGNIGVEKVELPDTVQEEYSLENALVYICNKPSSVPVHPAGPYLSNSMTIMVEAQEGLVPRSLIPCHRIDRVTSGLTICCIDVKVARLIQARIEQGLVQKLYLAKVHGSFPESCQREVGAECTEEAKWQWRKNSVLQVDAPIETVDPANGIRRITAKGKSSSSLFKILSYDAETDTSIISCRPLTGRSHQLRVHLEWLGFSIVNDTQYGGKRADLDSCSLMQGVERLADSMKEQQDGGKAAAELSSEDIQAAKEICSCCHNFSSSFTVSQLLQGGHEICLHASRYQIPFLPKNKKMYGINPIAKLELQVSPPVWSNDIHSDVWLE